MTKHIVLLAVVAAANPLAAGCVEDTPPADLFGRYELTRTLDQYSAWRFNEVEFAPQLSIALSEDRVSVEAEPTSYAIVLEHVAGVVRFELYEPGWTSAHGPVESAVMGYELEETVPGRVSGRAGAGLRVQTPEGDMMILLGFDVVGERIDP